MMDFNGINTVMQRIADIEKRFGVGTTVPPYQRGLSTGSQQDEKTPAAVHQGVGSASSAGKLHNTSTLPKGDFGSMILAAAKKYNVDPKLVSAVAETESGGNQGAVSSAGAVGVMQLMPDTAAALGVNPYDEGQNIEGGTQYLRQLLDSFNGDVKKAVAAYNAGSQAVRDYNGVPPYSETQNYVNKVLDLYQ
jgi:soluble lytic murein transglycosylase-like protein